MNPREEAYQREVRQVNSQLPIEGQPEDGPGLPRSADQQPSMAVTYAHPFPFFYHFFSLCFSRPLRSASGAYNLACCKTGPLHRYR